MVKAVLADVTISRVVGKEISVPAVDIAEYCLGSNPDEDLSIDDPHLPDLEASDSVGRDGKATNKIVESVIAGLDDPQVVR